MPTATVNRIGAAGATQGTEDSPPADMLVLNLFKGEAGGN